MIAKLDFVGLLSANTQKKYLKSIFNTGTDHAVFDSSHDNKNLFQEQVFYRACHAIAEFQFNAKETAQRNKLNIEDYALTETEVRDMLVSHLDNSDNLQFITIEALKNGVKEVLDLQKPENQNFFNSLLKTYKNHDVQKVRESETQDNYIASFTLNENTIYLNHGFTSIQYLKQDIQVILNAIRTHYMEELGLSSIFMRPSEIEANELQPDYQQFIFQAKDSTPINPKILQNIFLKSFELTMKETNRQTYYVNNMRETFPPLIKDIVLFCKMEGNLPAKEDRHQHKAKI